MSFRILRRAKRAAQVAERRISAPPNIEEMREWIAKLTAASNSHRASIADHETRLAALEAAARLQRKDGT